MAAAKRTTRNEQAIAIGLSEARRAGGKLPRKKQRAAGPLPSSGGAMVEPEFSVRIGHESIHVIGSQVAGWSVIPGDDDLYATLEELLFALINLSLALDTDIGTA